MEACHNYRGGVAVNITQNDEEVEIRVQLPRGIYEVPMF